jgi:hypothetical protein
MADPVIEEIHQTRRAISDRFNGDIGAIAADAAARQSSSGHPVWKPEAPKPRRGALNVGHTTHFAGSELRE